MEGRKVAEVVAEGAVGVALSRNVPRNGSTEEDEQDAMEEGGADEGTPAPDDVT
jgi:hypothetical protein